MFGWYDGDGPAVWRSVGGVDHANDVARAITTRGLEKLADLSDRSHEVEWRRSGRSFPLRFRLLDGPV